MFELKGDDFIQAGWAVQVQFLGAFVQVHGKQQRHQPQVMVAMQMADENVVNFMRRDLQVRELHLGPFSAIN